MSISLKGNSICVPFKLKIKANNRMINNNSNEKYASEYIWNINRTNNDIYFSISKDKAERKGISVFSIISLLLASIIGAVMLFINKKFKRNN